MERGEGGVEPDDAIEARGEHHVWVPGRDEGERSTRISWWGYANCWSQGLVTAVIVRRCQAESIGTAA
jgi:hypothetical protein